MDVLFFLHCFFKNTCTAPFPPPTAIPQETLHLLPLCSRSPSPCAFSSTSPFVCALVCCALFYQPIRLFRRGKLGAGINQRRHTQEAGTLAHAARLMMERIKKKVRSGKESMPPLPGQTLHLSHVTRWTEEKRGFLHSATMLPSLACV